jgi:hypothetical protein
MDGQYFENRASGQDFVIDVHRGERLRLDAWMHPSDQRVQGCRTYIGSDPYTKQREITWAVNMTTSGFVGGRDMTDETLRKIAGGLTIPSG